MFAGVAFSSYGGFWLGLGIYGTLAQACALHRIVAIKASHVPWHVVRFCLTCNSCKHWAILHETVAAINPAFLRLHPCCMRL